MRTQLILVVAFAAIAVLAQNSDLIKVLPYYVSLFNHVKINYQYLNLTN